MKLYIEYSQMTPDEMVAEKYEDMQNPPYEQRAVEARVKGFYHWLQKEYVSKKTKTGLAPKSALTYTAAVADFFSTLNMPLKFDWAEDFPASTLGRNETEKMTAEQIDMLASYAPTARDKALIWIMFQSGIDISQACKLTWGQVEKELLNPPLVENYPTVMLRGLERMKEPGRIFNTLFGKTAIHYLKLSLEKSYGKDYFKKLKYDEPLFLGRSGGRLKTRYAQAMMREIAPDSGIAGSRIEAADFNPISPRSLRASFADKMALAGASQILVDYLQGHKMKYGTAYFGGEEGLRESYVRYAKEVLEPSRLKSTSEIEAEIINQKKTVDSLIIRIEDLEKDLLEQISETNKMAQEAIDAHRDFLAVKQHYDEERALNEELKNWFEETRPIIERLKRIPGLLEKLM